MAKAFSSLYSSQNVRLFDLLFRHQTYLEGVKGGLSANYVAMLNKLYAEFGKFMFEVRYSNMNGFTKGELAAFIDKFVRAQISFYSVFTQQLIDLLKQFMADDVDVSTAIYANVTGLSLNQAEAQRDHGTVAGTAPLAGTTEADAQLWGKITNAPVPAVGVLPLAFVQALQDAHTNNIVSILRLGYANAWSMRQLRIAVFGTDKVGPDQSVTYSGATGLDNASADKTQSRELWNTPRGAFGRWTDQADGLTNTLLQHVSGITQAAIASVYFDLYQWVSILDLRTTLICRSRNGNVYTYGEGPLPPAHYNCRSKAVSVLGTSDQKDVPETFHEWMLAQPTEFQNDVLGPTNAARLRSGSYTDKTFQINNVVKPISVSDFPAKLPTILM